MTGKLSFTLKKWSGNYYSRWKMTGKWQENDHLPKAFSRKWQENDHLPKAFSRKNDREMIIYVGKMTGKWLFTLKMNGNDHLRWKNDRKMTGKIIIYEKHLCGKMLIDQCNNWLYVRYEASKERELGFARNWGCSTRTISIHYLFVCHPVSKPRLVTPLCKEGDKTDCASRNPF